MINSRRFGRQSESHGETRRRTMAISYFPGLVYNTHMCIIICVYMVKKKVAQNRGKTRAAHFDYPRRRTRTAINIYAQCIYVYVCMFSSVSLLLLLLFIRFFQSFNILRIYGDFRALLPCYTVNHPSRAILPAQKKNEFLSRKQYSV